MYIVRLDVSSEKRDALAQLLPIILWDLQASFFGLNRPSSGCSLNFQSVELTSNF